MRNKYGIVLTTNEQNPLQGNILAPFTVLENGRIFLRKRSDQRINLHMAVSIGEEVKDLCNVEPVIYRFSGDAPMNYHENGISIESSWYSPEYDRLEPKIW
jgi:hypothetical protein